MQVLPLLEPEKAAVDKTEDQVTKREAAAASIRAAETSSGQPLWNIPPRLGLSSSIYCFDFFVTFISG